MSTKFLFSFKALIIFCLNILICTHALGQKDKSYKPRTKVSTFHKKSRIVDAKQNSKKKSTARNNVDFGPAKVVYSFFDDSMFEFGAAETTSYFYDESTEEFGAAESTSDFYDESSEEFGGADRYRQHHDLTIENFNPVRPNGFNLKAELMDFFAGTNKKDFEQNDVDNFERGAAVKAGVIRKKAILVSRFPSKGELKKASEKSSASKTQYGYKLFSQLIHKPKEGIEAKEIINPR